MKNDEVHAQTVDPNKIACRDCIYRERDTIVIEGQIIRIGVRRSRCLIYNGENGKWKPNRVDIYNGPCEFYEQDRTADRFWEKK